MEIQIRQERGVTILTPRGKLTLNEGAGDLRKKARELIDSGDRRLVVNLEQVDYIDSTGIDSLIASFVTARKAEGDLRLSGLPARVLELMQITRLDTVFPIYAGEKEAVGSF